jgi:hypothetical protein
MAQQIDIKKDRLRYTKNSSSATQAYVAILFNVFYFVSIYNKDVGNFYYNKTIGFSVICNLLFLLAAFLCSEGVKNYKIGYALAFIPLGILQIVRVFNIPLNAYNTIISLDGSLVRVMDAKQIIWTSIFLICSAAACFATAIGGIYKTKMLKDYQKTIEEN